MQTYGCNATSFASSRLRLSGNVMVSRGSAPSTFKVLSCEAENDDSNSSFASNLSIEYEDTLGMVARVT